MVKIYFAGIDIGSTMTKVVIIDNDKMLRASVVKHTGAEHRRLANHVMEEALNEAGLNFEDITFVVSTGYGRISVPFADRQVTELTCHARGVFHAFPTVRLAIDIGGQDSKGLKIVDGRLTDFAMNDKCAAGTGRFLEILSEALGLRVEDLGEISLKSKKKISITSICTVFARQEVISLISQGVPLEDIAAGIHDSVASRVARMVERLRIEPDVVMTGGVSKNKGIVKAMQEKLGCKINIPDEPLLTGAIGAALIGREYTVKSMEKGTPVQTQKRQLDEASFYSRG